MAKGHQSGRRTTLTGSSGIAQVVRTRLADDPAWAHVARNGAWICPYCLSAIRGSDATRASLARAIEGHLDRRCTGWHAGNGATRSEQEIIAKQSHEEIAFLAANEPAWKIFDHEGFWYSPCSLQKVHTVRLTAGRFDSFTVQNMVNHLATCDSYRSGVIHDVASVQHARDANVRAVQLTGNIRNLIQYPVWRYANAQHHWLCPFCLLGIPNVPLISPVDWELGPDRMAWHIASECRAYQPEQPQTRNEAEVRRAAGGGEPRSRPTSQTGTRSGGMRIARSGSHPTSMTRTPQYNTAPMRTPLPQNPTSGGMDGTARPRVATPIQGHRQTPAAPPPIPTSIAPTTSHTPSGSARIAAPISGGHRPVKTNPTSGPTEPASGNDLLAGTIFDGFDTMENALPSAPPIEAGETVDSERHFNWMDEVEEATQVRDANVDEDRARARDVQVGLLGKLPAIPGFTFATRFEACDDVSGDFYDFITLPDGRIGFAQGDVSGHGIHAGLIMSMAKKTLSIYAAAGGSPSDTLAQVNENLVDDLGGRIFISMTYAILDPGLGTITWARAGHNPTVRYNLHTDELDEIKPKGMVVGMKKGPIFRNSMEEIVTQVRPGDVYLVYTDGINETMNRQNEEYGTELLFEVLRRHSASGPESLLDRIMDSIRQFRGGTVASDDTTVLALSVD